MQTSGFCVSCNTEHSLPAGNAYKQCLQLIQNLETHRNIDFKDQAPHLALDYLYGETRGQMFGILECADKNNKIIFLKAFSAHYNSLWKIDGWVEPIFDTQEYQVLVHDKEKEIKDLTVEIKNEQDPEVIARLSVKRKAMSQKLMQQIHQLYTFQNFKDDKKDIQEVFYSEKGIPTATGDCCAPKLLNHAAKNNLRPISIAEFYFGKETKSKNRKHKEFYEPCQTRCQPILGFMLCGIK